MLLSKSRFLSSRSGHLYRDRRKKRSNKPAVSAVISGELLESRQLLSAEMELEAMASAAAASGQSGSSASNTAWAFDTGQALDHDDHISCGSPDHNNGGDHGDGHGDSDGEWPDHDHNGDHDHDHGDHGYDGGNGCEWTNHNHGHADGLHVFPLLIEAPEETLGDPTVWENYDLSQTFALNSNPPASHTIFLDFDGHVTTGTEMVRM